MTDVLICENCKDIWISPKNQCSCGCKTLSITHESNRSYAKNINSDIELLECCLSGYTDYLDNRIVDIKRNKYMQIAYDLGRNNKIENLTNQRILYIIKNEN